MQSKTVSLLRDFRAYAPQRPNLESLLNSCSNRVFLIRNGIIDLTKPDDITADNRKFQRMYDWMGRGYDFAEQVVGRWVYGDAIERLRAALMSCLKWRNGVSVLHASIGIGTDLRYLPTRIDPASLHIVGLDISLGMLRKYQRNLEKWHLNADLIHAFAEALPFADDSFDVAFHNGDINFFNDKAKAIEEMLRVAKPDTKILLADETEKIVQDSYPKNPLTKGYFKKQDTVTPITDFIPKNVEDLHFETLWEDKFYCVTFRKP